MDDLHAAVTIPPPSSRLDAKAEDPWHICSSPAGPATSAVHILLGLRRAGHGAVVIDDLRAGGSCSEAVGDVPLVQRDVGDPDALAQVFGDYGPFDGVVHCAAYLSVPGSGPIP